MKRADVFFALCLGASAAVLVGIVIFGPGAL